MQDIPQVTFNKSTQNGVEGFEIIHTPSLIKNADIPTNHNPFDYHRLNFFAILMINEGAVNHKVDFESCSLHAKETLIISSGQIHAFDPNSSYEGHLILFNEAFIHKYLSKDSIVYINLHHNFFVGIKKYSEGALNSQFFHSLDTVLNSNLPEIAKSVLIGAELTKYLLNLPAHNHTDQDELNSKEMKLFADFRTKLQENYKQTRDARHYADELCVSYKMLNDACKKVVKQTAKAYIDSYMILEAKRLIVSTPDSFKEITFQLGFDEPTNFLKYFKKHTGKTPAEFRRSI